MSLSYSCAGGIAVFDGIDAISLNLIVLLLSGGIRGSLLLAARSNRYRGTLGLKSRQKVIYIYASPFDDMNIHPFLIVQRRRAYEALKP